MSAPDRDDFVARIGVCIAERVEAHPGMLLTSIDVGLPSAEPQKAWDAALTAWLREAAIDFVDVRWLDHPVPELLAARFEARWAD